MKSNLIRVREFGKGEETIDVGKLSSDLKGLTAAGTAAL